MKKATMALLLVFVAGLAALGYVLERNAPRTPVVSTVSPIARRPVLDAGHGGVDGGAVSCTGVNESEINLAIALRTELVMRFLGLSPVMTRTDDVSLHDSSAASIADKKRSDLANRVKLINAVENGALLSIHQNTFEQSRYSGAQVFYNGADGSKQLAEILQESLRQGLAPDNSRQPKPIDVYVMNRVTRPAALVECGFLSNEAEEANLRSESYQNRIAVILTAAFLRWTGERP